MLRGIYSWARSVLSPEKNASHQDDGPETSPQPNASPLRGRPPKKRSRPKFIHATPFESSPQSNNPADNRILHERHVLSIVLYAGAGFTAIAARSLGVRVILIVDVDPCSRDFARVNFPEAHFLKLNLGSSPAKDTAKVIADAFKQACVALDIDLPAEWKEHNGWPLECHADFEVVLQASPSCKHGSSANRQKIGQKKRDPSKTIADMLYSLQLKEHLSTFIPISGAWWEMVACLELKQFMSSDVYSHKNEVTRHLFSTADVAVLNLTCGDVGVPQTRRRLLWFAGNARFDLGAETVAESFQKYVLATKQPPLSQVLGLDENVYCLIDQHNKKRPIDGACAAITSNPPKILNKKTNETQCLTSEQLLLLFGFRQRDIAFPNWICETKKKAMISQGVPFEVSVLAYRMIMWPDWPERCHETDPPTGFSWEENLNPGIPAAHEKVFCSIWWCNKTVAVSKLKGVAELIPRCAQHEKERAAQGELHCQGLRASPQGLRQDKQCLLCTCDADVDLGERKRNFSSMVEGLRWNTVAGDVVNLWPCYNRSCGKVMCEGCISYVYRNHLNMMARRSRGRCPFCIHGKVNDVIPSSHL